MSTKPDGGEWTWDEIVTYCRRSNHYGDETPRGAPGWSQLANLIVAAERARHPHPAAPVASGGVEVRGVVLMVYPHCTELVIDDGGSGARSRLDIGPLPGAHVGQRVIVSVRLADPTEGG